MSDIWNNGITIIHSNNSLYTVQVTVIIRNFFYKVFSWLVNDYGFTTDRMSIFCKVVIALNIHLQLFRKHLHLLICYRNFILFTLKQNETDDSIKHLFYYTIYFVKSITSHAKYSNVLCRLCCSGKPPFSQWKIEFFQTHVMNSAEHKIELLFCFEVMKSILQHMFTAVLNVHPVSMDINFTRIRFTKHVAGTVTRLWILKKFQLH